MKKKKKTTEERVLDSFDQDPNYESGNFEDLENDHHLPERTLFLKRIRDSGFPVNIIKQLIPLYPKFEVEHRSKLLKLKNKSTFFYGKPGTGKTFMAIVLNLLSKKKKWSFHFYHTKFYRVSTLLNEVRYLVGRQNEVDPMTGISLYNTLVEDISCCKYLILDDLGAERSTDFTNEVLTDIINERYIHNRITIVTSNYKPEEFNKKTGNTRIISRLMEMVDGKPISLTKVYRITKLKPIKF